MRWSQPPSRKMRTDPVISRTALRKRKTRTATDAKCAPGPVWLRARGCAFFGGPNRPDGRFGPNVCVRTTSRRVLWMRFAPPTLEDWRHFLELQGPVQVQHADGSSVTHAPFGKPEPSDPNL